jgi:hypothetical protein
VTADLSTLPKREGAFSEKTSIFFKKMRIYRIPDVKRNTISSNHRRLPGQRRQRRANYALAVAIVATVRPAGRGAPHRCRQIFPIFGNVMPD